MSIPQSTVAPSFDRNRNLFAVGFRQYWPLVVTILCGGVLATASAQTFTNLYNCTKIFGSYPDNTNNDGAGPRTIILSGNALYGTASQGGSSGGGTVFKVNTDGSGYKVLKSFSRIHYDPNMQASTNSEGATPYAGVTLSDNTLYGTTQTGGSSGHGTVFKINIDGTGFTNLYSFSSTSVSFPYTNSDGANPTAGLILSDNTLYGTASQGGNSANGTLFAINIDGTGFTNLHSFAGLNYDPSFISTNSDGANPLSGLILSGNMLYGTAQAGGSFGNGTVFAINIDGTGFTNLHTFAAGTGSHPSVINSDGVEPDGRLLLSGNILYGTATFGGNFGNGTVFAVHTDGTGFKNLYSFKAASYSPSYYTNDDGAYPFAGLILSGNTLYGATSDGGITGNGTVFAVNIDGTSFTNLHAFTTTSGYPAYTNSDGTSPYSSLVLANNTLYGTAYFGGSAGNGTVFKISLPVPLNQGPIIATPIPDQNVVYGSAFNSTFAANTFSDSDAGQVLSYTADGLPPGITFDGPTRTFSGTPTNAGLYTVTITATDNGLPSLNTNDVFNIVVDKALLTISATSTNRLYGEANPPLGGTLTGVTNDDNITVLFSTVATPASPPGNYPVASAFLDPDNRLDNYLVITNSGKLTVNNVTLAISSINGVLTLSWPTNAGAFSPEYTDDLTPPVLWHPVTDGIITNGANICLTVVPEVAVPARFYRLQLPACADNNDKLGIFPPHSNPYGKSYGEWAAAFWQWAFALPLDGHPFLDSPNDPYFDFGASQSGNVWFWSSPDGPLTRIVTMPEDKALFLTIRDVETSSLETPDSGFHGDTEAEQRANSKWYADHITNVFCIIDGVAVNNLQAYRFSTPQFEFTAPTPWIFGGPDPDPNVGGTGTSVGDGYFLMIAPMSMGIHEIHYGGTFHFTLAADGFDADYPHDVTINLTITP